MVGLRPQLLDYGYSSLWILQATSTTTLSLQLSHIHPIRSNKTLDSTTISRLICHTGFNRRQPQSLPLRENELFRASPVLLGLLVSWPCPVLGMCTGPGQVKGGDCSINEMPTHASLLHHHHHHHL